MAEFKVAEKFVSINGEGRLAGQLSVFIRLAGCNLDCGYCDTKWANVPGAFHTSETENEIYSYILGTGICNVTITGGEPLAHENIGALLAVLTADASLHIEIETNGSVDISPFILAFSEQNRPSFTLDYKLNEMERYMNTANFSLLERNDAVKFVVGTQADLGRAKEILFKYDLLNKCAVYFSPVFGEIEPREIVEFMKSEKLNNVNMQLQLHKYIWEPQARGV